MNCKTLLVHLDDSAHAAARLDYALALAARHDAHLIGLYLVCEDPAGPLFLHGEDIWSAGREAQRNDNRKRAHAACLAAADRAGRGVEWRAPEGPPGAAAILHARHADLLILGQDDPEDSSAFIARHFVEDVIMESGRPAIVLPYAGPVRPHMDNVMIAWDGGRESARAATDALPLIRRASFVTIIEVQRHPHYGEPACIDVAAWLARHGIEASFTATLKAPGVDTGAMLLDALTDRHVDLLVMGAYGHARVQERLLGGVTRNVLQAMTVPVLMSH
ncbi:universal stress protein [Paraburkholderia sp. 22099]|jgi:nucleotide-binding universal stress UspA family protein|uniref:universal stress protein n=1 Tax=Paraburkholderia TaxID=1822464 RepID=UPI0028602337|nr:universal stress protein [Paraburkholderia terricola]MDR6494015.1 nucleotide-binding universal stress UspA family protein [Paraburkholderia terricola]